MTPTIAELTAAIEQEVEKCAVAQRLRMHPGVGGLTAVAFVLIIGRAERFQCGKLIACCLGLVPWEDSDFDRGLDAALDPRVHCMAYCNVAVTFDPDWHANGGPDASWP